MTTWTSLTAEHVRQAMPAGMATMYTMWIAAVPEREARLAVLTTETILAVRSAVESGSPWALDRGDATSVPASGFRHAIHLALFNQGMEMGHDFPEAFYARVTRAEVWLRGVQAGMVAVAGMDTDAPSPSYRRPGRGRTAAG